MSDEETRKAVLQEVIDMMGRHIPKEIGKLNLNKYANRDHLIDDIRKAYITAIKEMQTW